MSKQKTNQLNMTTKKQKVLLAKLLAFEQAEKEVKQLDFLAIARRAPVSEQQAAYKQTAWEEACRIVSTRDSIAAEWQSVRKADRDAAEKLKSEVLGWLNRAAKIGGDYSGSTHYVYGIGDVTNAFTKTYDGERYSRACKYRKTNAEHTVSSTISDAVNLLKLPSDVLQASLGDGLPLIGATSKGSVIWVRRVNKSIESQEGYLAYGTTTNGRCIVYHAQSKQEADKGLKIKLQKENDREAEVARIVACHKEQARNQAREKRRASLLGRIAGVQATYQQARELGFCEVGIKSFQSRFGIGNSATLNQLVATEDPSAVRLALHVARAVRRAAK